MDCASYLTRIGFAGRARPDFDTLRLLQRGHLQFIPFENLDVKLGRPVTLDPEAAFSKLVTRRRGGWCYEMNGLFLRVLERIGFRVLPLTGAVMRRERGAAAIGNHLLLSVQLDQTYVVDVGLGDGPIEPIPLKEGSYTQAWRRLSLERLDDGWWRFHNHDHALASTLDFQHQRANWDLLAAKCRWQQTSAESRLKQNAVCLCHSVEGTVALIGRVLKNVGERGATERTVNSADEYVKVLNVTFGIDLPEAISLWPAISLRHDELFGSRAS
jgi:N-hydroxyarylamine O-acetyltransferase